MGKKFSLTDDNIDRQIQAIHYAIALKLLAEPALVAQVREKIERNKAIGKMRYGAYIHWLSTLDNMFDKDTFIRGMTEFTPQLRKWRRHTPFTGILTEQERSDALDAHACGKLHSVLF
ncbi:hypothetical protein [Gayadomonas joobiniege]|uniref:hypothetical protein n=1 Tax=Gayadomonas joobiniege TaxID=1234606 RepID=UPI00037C10F4|nr:hypothetical protein [Gayadomonas joobiniege]